MAVPLSVLRQGPSPTRLTLADCPAMPPSGRGCFVSYLVGEDMKMFGRLLQSGLLRYVLWMTVPLAITVVLVCSPVASAHERRKAGTHTMVVGWAEEPA